MKRYVQLTASIFPGILRRKRELIREQIIAFVMFSILFSLLNLSVSASIGLSFLREETKEFFNPPVALMGVMRGALLIGSIGMMIYLFFYYSQYISKFMLLEKANLLARYQQVFDKAYVLAELFAIIFLPVFVSVLLALISSYVMSPFIIERISESGYIFENMSYQSNIFRDLMIVLLSLVFVVSQFFIHVRYRKKYFR